MAPSAHRWNHAKSRHERGYGYAWQKLRASVLHRDAHLCQPCLSRNLVTPATQVDHIVPKADGGSDALDNLQAICAECHTDKTARDKGHGSRAAIGLDGWPLG